MENDAKNRSDRRKHTRYEAKPVLFVEIMPGHRPVGPVVDISKSGLAFHYVDQEFETEESFNVSLVTPDDEIIVDDLNVKTVYDFEIMDDSISEVLVVRRRGVQIDGLKQEHTHQLYDYIEHYTQKNM